MTQISRPFQIALVAMALFAAVWFVALRGHSGGSEGAGSSASSAGAQASAPAKTPGGGTSASSGAEYHGSAPGVAGLTRAIAKAQGAVAQSQQNAQRLQDKAAQATQSASTPAASTSPSASPSASSSSAQSSAASTKAVTKAGTKAGTAPATAGSKAATHAKSGVATMQPIVEGELKQGKVVAILFWNPQGSVDTIVHHELLAAGHALGGEIAVHAASAKQVGLYGTFTRTVQVNGTPTILLVNVKGQTSSLTGLTDAFSIAQAVKEAKQAQH
jgi:hypothetical protein